MDLLFQNNQLYPFTTSKQEKEKNLFWSEFVLGNPILCEDPYQRMYVYKEVQDLLFELFDKSRNEYSKFMFKNLFVFTDLYKAELDEVMMTKFLNVLSNFNKNSDNML